MDTWLTGPVAVTGATGHVGKHLLARLAELPNDVRPLGRGDDLHAAFADAQAAVLLTGALQPTPPDTYESSNLDTVLAAKTALEGSSVERVVLLSSVGADPAADNEYLRAKGRAEWSVLRASCSGVVILRATYIVGRPEDPGPTAEAFLLHERERLDVLGDGSQQVQPVFVEDVVEAIVTAALAPNSKRGTLELGGPDVMSLEELVELLNHGPVPEKHWHRYQTHLRNHWFRGLKEGLVDYFLADNLAHQPLADVAYDLERTSLRELWAREEAFV